MTTILPTVGRKVWYRTGNSDQKMNKINPDDPLDATIVGIWADGLINVVVFDSHGNMFTRTGIRLRQEGETISNQSYCEWMPYQVGQAKAATTPQATIELQAQEPQRPDAVQTIKPRPKANKVTQEQITALMDRVVFRSNVDGTSTFVHAYLDGKFYLASGHSACVDPANFNAETGYTIARANAKNNACHKLWELEGYALWKQMQTEPKQDDRKHLFTTSQLLTMVKDAESRGFEKVIVDDIVYVLSELKSELKHRGM